MTQQMSDLAVRRSAAGWEITRTENPRWQGNSQVHVLDESGRSLLSVDLTDALPGFDRFAHWTTAGMDWGSQRLGYLTELDGMTLFVVRAWWGDRLVIDLDGLRLVEDVETSSMVAAEADIVLAGLRQLVSDLEQIKSNDPRPYDR